MRNIKKIFLMSAELAAVLLLTAASFTWGRTYALIERGYTAYGGEYLLLLTAPVYYIAKRIVLDWIQDIRKQAERESEKELKREICQQADSANR